MINNSSTERWIRLESKSLDQQFLNEIVHGLNCSPFEASAVLDTVYKVYDCYFETNTELKPGQIRLQLVAIEARPSQKISEAIQVTVTLTLNDDQEDLDVRKKHGIVGLTKTVALETAEQGITCNAICPGWVKTPLVEKQIDAQARAHGMPAEDVVKNVILERQPTKKFVNIEEVAALALFLASDAAASITGASMPIDGGWVAH